MEGEKIGVSLGKDFIERLYMPLLNMRVRLVFIGRLSLSLLE
jgi:hypothetical protein